MPRLHQDVRLACGPESPSDHVEKAVRPQPKGRHRIGEVGTEEKNSKC